MLRYILLLIFRGLRQPRKDVSGCYVLILFQNAMGARAPTVVGEVRGERPKRRSREPSNRPLFRRRRGIRHERNADAHLSCAPMITIGRQPLSGSPRSATALGPDWGFRVCSRRAQDRPVAALPATRTDPTLRGRPWTHPHPRRVGRGSRRAGRPRTKGSSTGRSTSAQASLVTSTYRIAAAVAETSYIMGLASSKMS